MPAFFPCRRTATLFLPGIVLSLLVCSCGSAPDPWKGEPGPPRVVTSFAPLTCFVKNVAGDHVGLLTLATSRGPHHFEPTVEETQKLRKADLFFINGLELDDGFADRMAQSSGNRRLKDPAPGYVRIGDRLLKETGLIDAMAAHEGHNHGPGKGHEGHVHGEFDPHIWLGIPQAIRMVEVIRDELKLADPARTEIYEGRAKDYVATLQKLHTEGRALLEKKKERSLVTNHDSLHYFARSFDLTVAGVIQLQAGTDADAATLGELVKTCKERGVRVIAAEPQFQQRGAVETLLGELKRRGVVDPVVIEIDPLETVTEGETLDAGWYARRMRANLESLAKALR